MSWLLAFLGFAALIILHEARPLRRGQGGRHARRALRAVLPAADRTSQARRDRVRDRRDPARRLREDHRDEPGARRSRRSIAHRAYYRQPVWKRIVVIAAGPAVNIVLAFVILVGLLFSANGDGEPTRPRRRVETASRRPRRARSRATGSSRSTACAATPSDARDADRDAQVRRRGRSTAARPTTPATLTCRATASSATVAVTPRYDAEPSATRCRLRVSRLRPRPSRAASRRADGLGSDDVARHDERRSSTIARIFERRAARGDLRRRRLLRDRRARRSSSTPSARS